MLAMLYVPYKLVLSNESFFRFNRIVLLCFMVLSLIVPLFNVTCMSADEQPVVHAVQHQMIEAGIPVRQAEAEFESVEQMESISVSWFQVASAIYIIGMVLILFIRIFQFCRMGMFIRSKCLWKERYGGVTVYCHLDNVVPFSWFGCIVIGSDDYCSNGREIILHEKGHILCRHSYDIIFLTAVQMLQWWNPLVYLLGISLRDIHEYEADDYVLRQGVSIRSYHELLIKKAVGSSSYAFANNFNHSLIKNRITMICRKSSNPWMRSKVLYVIPTVALALSAFATPEFATSIEAAVGKLNYKDMKFSSGGQQNRYLKSDDTDKKLVVYVSRGKGKTHREFYRVCFPKGTWIDNGDGNGHLEKMYTSWSFEASNGETVLQVDGVTYGKSSLPDLPYSAARKIEIRKSGDRQTVNIITKNVIIPFTVKDNVPREQTIFLHGHNSLGIINKKATPGDWVHYSVTDWEQTAWGYSIRNEFEHSRHKPDLTVYVYASTEATKGEINRVVAILKELGISNYKVTENIPIKHWTDSQYRDWAVKQKQQYPEYDWRRLFDAIASEGVDGGDFNAKWHIVKNVYGVK